MTTRYAWQLNDPTGLPSGYVEITPDDNNDIQTTVGAPAKASKATSKMKRPALGLHLANQRPGRAGQSGAHIEEIPGEVIDDGGFQQPPTVEVMKQNDAPRVLFARTLAPR